MTTPADASTSPAERLNDLAASALLGTERAGSKGGATAAAAILREAAILNARRRAGQRADKAPTPITECPNDPLAPVSVACASTLRMLLQSGDAEMIEEWAELGASVGRRVPDALAASMLDWWARQPEASNAVRAVLGVRLEWLCSLNPNWRKRAAAALPADLNAAWQTGATPERLALLIHIRGTEPARAESLVRATWDQDSADERRRFLERFDLNLSMADEPFLEWVLDDRSKQARAVASAFLTRLPDSRFAGRMVDRGAAMIRVEQAKKGLLRRASETITIEPPQEWDKAWERDGMDEKPSGGVGKRAWWMSQVLASTLPHALAARTGLAPDRLIAALAESDYAKQALPAVCAAAAAARDEPWCRALIEHLLDEKKPDLQTICTLVQPLPPPARESLLVEILPKAKAEWIARCNMLAHAVHRWSPEFSQSICVLLAKDRPAKAPDAWSTSGALDHISRRIHPSSLAAFEKFISEVFRGDPPPSAIKSLDRVRLRADMHKEFAA